MITFIFDDIEQLNNWRNSYIEQYGEIPRLTAKIINGERTFTASVSL